MCGLTGAVKDRNWLLTNPIFPIWVEPEDDPAS